MAETCVKNYIKKHVKLILFVNLRQIHEISGSFSSFAFISPKFAQILKYFAQSCDCMITAFRNSGASICWPSSWTKIASAMFPSLGFSCWVKLCLSFYEQIMLLTFICTWKKKNLLPPTSRLSTTKKKNIMRREVFHRAFLHLTMIIR